MNRGLLTGCVCAAVVLWAALTGMLMVRVPQIADALSHMADHRP